MSNKIVIVGAGFAGVWSALSAKRLARLTNKEDNLQVLVIAPESSLIMRPRLYEANPSEMSHPLGSLFKSAGIDFLEGTAEKIHALRHTVQFRSSEGIEATINYDRLILAAGSSVVRPHGISGIEQNAFDVDSLSSATKLEAHLRNLASLPASPARSTVVVCGAGFTGIEVATELPRRLHHIPDYRIVLVENANEVGPGLGPGPRPIISEALNELGVEVKLGSAVAAIDADSVTLASGERIKTKTAIWTAGIRATPLTHQVPGERDPLSRLRVDQNLRVPSAPDVFATGDAACAFADDKGHHALMSCQHALQLGRVSGHNAAADLLGEPLMDYVQAAYNCCLDLGAWGAVIAGGWEKEVKVTGDLAKRVKCHINQKLIYPPEDVQQALEWANPIGPDSDQLMQQILEAVA
ncbi:hypothetical protein UA08_04011 [Talaromyces atroroseus]|uniref:FAD/NAD(P)-binding domain-containing protein n=1 Tax=Talaromyces atroroseus TaxID=1441469 RepID=A0A1Q5Q8A6_TALAT|nr:hypothetical protein UA08_04011 [Talaromyces atroroseus]OKL60344.1 hypothetical protein UA08_04011 [Talaromyces atroroseus]